MATDIANAVELRELEQDELVGKLLEAKEELFNLRFQAATGQLESHGRLRAVKHEIARIYTVMRERELGIITFVEEAIPAAAAAEETDGAGEVDEAPAKARRASKKAPKA